MRRLAPAFVAAALVAACGGTAPSERAAGALEQRLEGKRLSVRSIDCLDSGVRFSGEVSWRCTVNFGDPHVVPYCVALVDGKTFTDRETGELRCYPPQEEARYRDNARLEPAPSSSS